MQKFVSWSFTKERTTTIGDWSSCWYSNDGARPKYEKAMRTAITKTSKLVQTMTFLFLDFLINFLIWKSLKKMYT